jgi:hypothetical protein
MNDKKQEENPSAFHSDRTDAGQSTRASDEALAAERGISVEQLRKERAKALARVYAYILSWELPATKE